MAGLNTLIYTALDYSLRLPKNERRGPKHGPRKDDPSDLVSCGYEERDRHSTEGHREIPNRSFRKAPGSPLKEDQHRGDKHNERVHPTVWSDTHRERWPYPGPLKRTFHKLAHRGATQDKRFAKHRIQRPQVPRNTLWSDEARAEDLEGEPAYAPQHHTPSTRSKLPNGDNHEEGYKEVRLKGEKTEAQACLEISPASKIVREQGQSREKHTVHLSPHNISKCRG
jgi:hypothetical protein